MKKTLSLFLAFVIILSTFVFTPLVSEAALYTPDQTIYAHAYMLINLDDSDYPVVAEQNADERLYPASLTKIATAMVVLNKVSDLSQKTVMTQTAYDQSIGTGAQVAGIEVGEELSIETLLYLTMVHSACDACEVLAEFVSGSKESFVAEMNSWAQSLGCKDTNFVNPDGLHDPNHYTTARDMSLMTLEALKNETFVKISTTTSVEFHGYTLPHTNLMLQPGYITYYYEYAQGIKTGSTEEAEYCVITKASKNGYNYLAIVMKSPQQEINGESYKTKCSFVDAKTLFEWAFNSLKYTTLVRKDEVIGEVNVKDGKDADTVQLVAKDDVNEIVPAGLDMSSIIYDFKDKPEEVNAPVSKGEQICTADILYGNEVVATVDLVAAQTVELSTFLKVINAVKAFFSSLIVKVILILLVLFAIIYVLLLVNSFSKKKQKRKKINKRNDSRDVYLDDNDDLPPPKRYN